MDMFKHSHVWNISLIVSVLIAEGTGLRLTVTNAICGREVNLAPGGQLYLDYFGADLTTFGGIPYIETCKITVKNTSPWEMICVTSFTPSCRQIFKYYYDGFFFFGKYLTCADIYLNPRCHKVSEIYAAFESFSFTGTPPTVSLKIYSPRRSSTETTTKLHILTSSSSIRGNSDGDDAWNSYYNIPIIIGIIVLGFAATTCCFYVCHKRRVKRFQNPLSPWTAVMNMRPMEVASVQGHTVSIHGNPFQTSSTELANNLQMQDIQHTNISQQTNTIQTSDIEQMSSTDGAENQTGSDHSNSADVTSITSPNPWDPPTYESLFGEHTQTTQTYYDNLAYR